MYTDLDRRKLKLKKALCKLDFIDLEELCDLLANFVDFFGLVYEKMSYAVKEYKPDYEFTRALYRRLLNDKENGAMFKYLILDYLTKFYYENKIERDLLPDNVIEFKKN